MKIHLLPCVSIASLLAFVSPLCAQVSYSPTPLDPTRNLSNPQMLTQDAPALPEQYIWTANSKRGTSTPHLFRATFQANTVPSESTLYVAGPSAVEVYVNGRLAEKLEASPDIPIKDPVSITVLNNFLKPGKNVLALRVTPRNTGYTEERFLAAKIVPRAPGIYAPALLISGPDWKSTENTGSGWQNVDFDDSSWQPVQSFGAVESSIEFYQANNDAGMYRWPGYVGASKFLAHTTIPAHKVEQPFSGRSQFENIDALTTSNSGKDFTVHAVPSNLLNPETPSILLDFGEEITGRLKLVSDSGTPLHVIVQYGESRDEALIQPYLGADPIIVPPHATAYGPKSSFRYAKLSFVGNSGELRFRQIALDAIYYPVQYQGSFESSDPLLNRIWELGVYTSHLCMQDDIWDAPKRDRARWAGDLDVSGRVIDDVFGDRFLMQDTMSNLIGNAPVTSHVNDIAGYSAWWISEVTQYYLHTGETDYLQSLHERLVQLLQYMDKELDAKNLYVNSTHSWPFVDWSPELNGDTPEARRATEFEFYLAYRDAAYVLRQLNDPTTAEHYNQRAQQLRDASQKYLLDTSTNTFGDRWQTNAIAVYSGVASSAQYAPIWDHVLSSVPNTRYTALVMTPYYNYYIISAMAQTGHTAEALNWIRSYWGGMIAEGATSYWEGYYPSWPKSNFHASLQADDGTGYFVSLAHGWSAGPTAWLMEQVLGIQPTAPGFRQVTIRPDLAGLTWAKGAEPTPHGLLQVSLKSGHVEVTLPAGVEATVLVPTSSAQAKLFVNGKQIASAHSVENGARAAVVLRGSGTYDLQAQ